MPRRSFISEFAAIAAAYPEKTAMVTENSQLSFSDILALVHQFDLQTKYQGVKERSTILMCSDRPEFVLAMSLLLSLRGHTVIFSNLDAVNDAGIDYDVAIVDDNTDQPSKSGVLTIDEEWFATMGTVPVPDYSQTPPQEGASVTTTAGTTGRPRFLYKDETARLNDMDGMRYSFPTLPIACRVLCTSPVTTSMTMNFYFATLLDGGSVVALKDHLNRATQYIDLYGVNRLVMAPAIANRIVDTTLSNQLLTGLREVIVGGAITTMATLQRLSKMIGGDVYTAYGCSEFGLLAIRKFDPEATQEPGDLGKHFRSDVVLGLLNVDPTDGAGQLTVSSKSGGERRYLGEAPKSDHDVGFLEGLFLPGDIVQLTEATLTYHGRYSNIVNIGANKYSLEMLEQALSSAFQGFEFVALSTGSGTAVEDEGLVVFGKGPVRLSLDDINAAFGHVSTRLRAREFRQLDEFPILRSGKIDRQSLTNLF